MLKARVFPKYKNMIRIIWFCILFTAYTCSLHENLHYHVPSPMVYVKQASAVTLLLALVAIVFTLNNGRTISIFIVILYWFTWATWWEYLIMIMWLDPILKVIKSLFFSSSFFWTWILTTHLLRLTEYRSPSWPSFPLTYVVNGQYKSICWVKGGEHTFILKIVKHLICPFLTRCIDALIYIYI